jgi:hypothetical protein
LEKNKAKMKLLTHILLMPIVVIIGAISSAVISSMAGCFTGSALDYHHELTGHVEYHKNESTLSLGTQGILMGAFGGAMGGIIGAAFGWITKKPMWGALASLSLPALLHLGVLVNNSSNRDGNLMWLAVAISGPPLAGSIAGMWAKSFDDCAGSECKITLEQGEQS